MTGNVLSVDKNSYSCFEFNFNYKRSKCLTFNKSCFTVLITICVLLSVLNRNASIVSFTFGVFNLVFWLLTYCQCPFPCDQYQGKHCLVCSLRMSLSITSRDVRESGDSQVPPLPGQGARLGLARAVHHRTGNEHKTQ